MNKITQTWNRKLHWKFYMPKNYSQLSHHNLKCAEIYSRWVILITLNITLSDIYYKLKLKSLSSAFKLPALLYCLPYVSNSTAWVFFFQSRSPLCFVTIKTKQKHSCRPRRKARPLFWKLSSSWTLSAPSWWREEPSVGWTSFPWRMWRYCMLNTNDLLWRHWLCLYWLPLKNEQKFCFLYLQLSSLEEAQTWLKTCFLLFLFSRHWGRVIFKNQL